MVSTDLIVYGDYMSQPSRAVFAFCLLNKIPHQVQIVSVVAMDQYSAEFKAVNPNAKVPAISDNGLKLFESNTILRYLHDTRKCADHWYPKEERARAKVEEYL
jgi:glutathione S-transferase